MADNNRTEYKVIADKLASPDDNIIVELSGAMYKGSVSAGNRYVTVSELGEGGGGSAAPKTWESPSTATYTITQEHGGVEVTTESRTVFTQTYTVTGINETDFEIVVTGEEATMFSNYWSSSVYQRDILLITQQDNIPLAFVSFFETEVPGSYTAIFRLPYIHTFIQGDFVELQVRYGGPPVKWWDANDLENDLDSGDFRGAKIDYHAFITDGGTMIGTIYIAKDGSDNNVTHLEVTSGGTDSGTAHLWNRSGSENELYLYRVDGEGQTVRIHWTAQVYYSPEFYD